MCPDKVQQEHPDLDGRLTGMRLPVLQRPDNVLGYLRVSDKQNNCMSIRRNSVVRAQRRIKEVLTDITEHGAVKATRHDSVELSFLIACLAGG